MSSFAARCPDCLVSVVKFTAPFSSPSPVSYTERARKLERDSSNFPKLYDFFHDNLTESRNTVISFTRGRSNGKKKRHQQYRSKVSFLNRVLPLRTKLSDGRLEL
nr:uncharacterized protein LOC104644738 [Solanum lycopersicum]